MKKHVQKTVGQSVEETCYKPSSSINYAKIYNPEHKLVKEGNSGQLTISQLKLKHNGTWTCVLQLKGRLTEVKNTILIEGKHTKHKSFENKITKANF